MKMHLTEKILHFPMLWLLLLMATTVLSCNRGNMSNDVIVENEDYTVTADSVVRGDYTAYAPNDYSIVTNYTSPVNDSLPNVIRVRLSVGERDNELPPARYHHIDLDQCRDQATVKAFVADSITPKATHNIAPRANVRVMVDMSELTSSLRAQGKYVTPTHDTIYQHDYERGKMEMTVDLGHRHAPLRLRIDEMTTPDGNYVVTLPLKTLAKQNGKYHNWQLAQEQAIASMPQYSSKQRLVNAIYNMSVEQVTTPHENHSSLLASECYDIALSLAYLQPEQSMERLRAMVRDSVITIEQDKRSYTSLANDLIWAQAAWSVYCATGDKAWLSYAHIVIVNSLNQLRSVAESHETGLYHALCPYTSSLSRQYYPAWATTVDAFETLPLVGNIMIEHAYRLLGQIADEFELNKDYDVQADRIEDAINHRLWNEARGCYTQYLYGGVTPVMSPCVDNMGQALSILWDIANDDRAETIINETPVTTYGLPVLHPNRDNAGTGLNNTIVPMVQAMWNLAAAKSGNMSMLRRGMGALIAQQALTASCSYCWNASSGEMIPCDNPTGNASGNIAMVLRVIAGMNFLPGGIELNPRVPVCFGGNKTLSNFRYRNATLTITIKGTGDDYSKITLDGKAIEGNFIAGDLQGKHKIVITMNGNYAGSGVTTIAQKMKILPDAPQWMWDGYYGTNYSYNPNLGYKILINGQPTYPMRDSVMGTRDTVTYRNYSIVAINKYGHGYISKPHYITSSARCYPLAKSAPALATTMALPSQYGHRPIELSSDSTMVQVPVTTNAAGDYIIDVLYGNGNGSPSMTAPCQMIEVLANGHPQGAVAVPPTGIEQWLHMGYSSHLNIKLLKGSNTVQLRLAPAGMPHSTILLSHLRIIKVGSKQ